MNRWIREAMYPIVFALIDGKDLMEVYKMANAAALAESQKRHLKRNTVKLLQTGVTNLALLMAARSFQAEVIRDWHGTVGAMEAQIDYARFIGNGTLELLWFDFEPTPYDRETYQILHQEMHWNARAFELNGGARPFRLTLINPLVNTQWSTTYVVQTKWDRIAEMADTGQYYAKMGPECMLCRRCPAWRTYADLAGLAHTQITQEGQHHG